MKDIRMITGKRIAPSFETVSALLGAKNTDAACRQVRDAFEELLVDVERRVRPKAALCIDTQSPFGEEGGGKRVLMAILTIGDGIGRLTEQLTAKNDMMKAMTADAMADSCLFAFEEQLLPYIRRICMEEGYGIEGRLEWAKEVQEMVFHALEAERTLGLSITSEAMLKPEKSMSLLFELTEDTTRQQVEHNCKRCRNEGCPLRKKQQLVLTVEQAASISCPVGSNLSEVLRENGILLPFYCGGTGTCGKCGVLVKKGSLPITSEDRAAFSEDALQKGMRLSCRAVLQGDVTIALQGQEEAFFQTPETEGAAAALQGKEKAFFQMPETEEAGRNTETKRNRSRADRAERPRENGEAAGYGIAIDIGTTTLAFALTELENGKTADTYTAVNSQRAFGADVLTRMQAANAGKGALLSRAVRRDILTGVLTLLERNCIEPQELRHIVIAANTVMLHLLRGYSCKELSRYPFTPVTLETEELTLSELYADIPKAGLSPLASEQIRLTLLPGISAFVGADITAGLYACNILKADTAALFLDLGTNGEMALKKDGLLYTASAAAGPAFEAGNIKWGMPGIAGAISQVTIQNSRPAVKTIAGCPPKGICGTGVLEAVAELYRAGLLDTGGKLKAPYFPDGFPLAKTVRNEDIILTQQDIREIQMAKAAIRAGIEILMQHAGIQWGEIGQVFLAGGFGYFLDIQKAAAIGLLPKELLIRTKSVGNTSLAGAQRCLQGQAYAELERIKKSAREVSLAQDSRFQELYLTHMAFEEAAG